MVRADVQRSLTIIIERIGLDIQDVSSSRVWQCDRAHSYLVQGKS